MRMVGNVRWVGEREREREREREFLDFNVPLTALGHLRPRETDGVREPTPVNYMAGKQL